MADYLSREEILRVFGNLTVKNPDDKYQHGMQDAIDCLIPEVINGMESADVQLVRHGRWICNEELYYNGMTKCSCCNEEYYTEDIQNLQGDLRTVNYCPNCGARMDGEQNES